MNQSKIGTEIEALAADYLQSHGQIIIQQNYRCYRGEIDIITRDQNQVTFVEVRFRTTTHFGNALQSISTHKQKKVIATAKHFLQQKNWLYKVSSRFDIIVVQPNKGNMQLQWIKNAFSDHCGF